MDPISLDKLLSVTDEMEAQRDERRLTVPTLHRIVAAQTQAKNLERRTRDILRVLLELGWLLPQSESEAGFDLTNDFAEFITAWNKGDLLGISRSLTAYSPYARFLRCLCEQGAIQVPKRQDKVARRELGRGLKKKYNITFVAFDTFRVWAVAVGQAYLSPFEETLYWGGDWDDEQPLLETFKAISWGSYCEIEKTSGYANIGRLADAVCCRLHISFQAFEMKMNKLVRTEPGLFTLAPATIRAPSRLFQIVTVRPRAEVLKDRLAAQLLNHSEEPAKSQWLEHRYLEDGIRINGQLVKLIRWEVFNDTHR